MVEPYDWTDAHIIEVGSRDINGGVRHLFRRSLYTGLDRVEGPGVDVVADGATWAPNELHNTFDLYLCLEVFEHTPEWPQILYRAWELLRPGGKLLVTAACNPRAPHSAVDGCELRPNEYYENLVPSHLQKILETIGFRYITVTTLSRGDVQTYGAK